MTQDRAENAFVSIDYNEDDPKSYRGVVVKRGRQELARWTSGDPQADWAGYLAWKDGDQAKDMAVLETSSITHFLFDVPGWRMIEDERGRETIVPEDRPGHEDRDGNIIAGHTAPATLDM